MGDIIVRMGIEQRTVSGKLEMTGDRLVNTSEQFELKINTGPERELSFRCLRPSKLTFSL